MQPAHNHSARQHPSDLLRQDYYSVEQLASLLDVSPLLVEQAAFHGDLRAVIHDHHVLLIRRNDAIDWLSDHRRPHA